MTVKQQLIRIPMTFVLIMSLFLIFSGGVAKAAPITTGPVGYVDFVSLINQHPDTAQANANLKIEQEALKQEFASKAVNLTDREKQELDWQLNQRLEQKRQELLKPISVKVLEAANEVAKEKGLAIIISKQDVVCGGMDVTSDVLKKISGNKK